MRKTVVRTTIAIGGVALGVFFYVRWLNLPPSVDIPSPVLPSPNGFDALYAAGKLEARDNEASQAITTRVQEGEHVYSVAEKEALVAANQATLAAARQALTLPYCDPPDLTGAANYPAMKTFRALSRLFVLDGQVKEAHRDYSGAAQSGIDAMAVGIAAPHGGALISELVGVACEAIGERLVWREVNTLDAAGASAAAARLDALMATRNPFADTIRDEKWSGQATFVKEFRRKSAIGLFTEYMKEGQAAANYAIKVTDPAQSGAGDDVEGIPASEMIGAYKYFATHSKRRIVADYCSLIDAYATQSTEPFTASGPDIPAPTDPFSQVLVPLIKPARFRDVQMRAQGGLLTCALALRAYRVQHGDYPSALSDLVTSGILKKIPADPFARAEDLGVGYRRLSADKYLL